LRKLIRRAVRNGKMIGIDTPFLVSLSDVVIDQYSGEYIELKENKDFIKNT